MLEWAVDRTSSDKLQEVLNAMSEAGRELELVQWIGGRDWVVISSRQLEGTNDGR